MRFVLDENLPMSLVEEINNLGFMASHVRLIGLRGASDEEIATYAKGQQAILITKDLEFGSILFYPPGSHYGLIVMRLPPFYKKEQIMKTLLDFLMSIKRESLINTITILGAGRYRQRRLENGS